MHSRPKPTSIRQRFTYSLAAVVGGTFIILAVIFIIYTSRSLEKDLQIRLNNLSQLAVNGLSSALWQYNYDYIDDYLDSLFNYEGVVFTSVYAGDQLVREKIRLGLAEKEIKHFTSSTTFITKQSDILYQGTMIGTIHLVMSRDHVNRMIIRTSGMAAIVLCLIISGIFVTMFFLFRKYLFAPLAHLEDSAQSISMGNFDTKIDTSSKDEIGNLARVLDQMIKQLTITMASRDELEAEIAERIQAETDNKKLTAQLLQAQKMESIGNLAGGIAHDFNNILSSIIGFTELALDAAPKGSSQRDDLEEVYIAGNRAKELVQQILAFARQSEEKTKPVRLSDIVTEVLKLLRPSTPTTIEVKSTLNSTARVMGNGSQLNQIIMNLCTNAIHSLQTTGGTLEISLRNTFLTIESESQISTLPPGEYVELTVSDDGSGIDPTIISNIFEPYFTTKGVGEGTGMGLAMVKGIIESYGGNIDVKSEPGIKTSFVINLPVATGKNVEELQMVEEIVSGTERILLVDDELPIARVGSRMLGSLGYAVTMQTSSTEALTLFRTHPDTFDLVITDMTMPLMTGDVLAKEIREIRPDIPIIICTGYSNRMNEDGAKKIGINAFSYKPFTKPELALTIRKVLDKSSITFN